MTSVSTPRAKPGTAQTAAAAKVEQPAKEYSDPAQVAADPSLSTRQKRQALNSLEQDARQLAVAAGEGMSGGEETKLRHVMETKRSLESPSPDDAFAVVLRTFEDALNKTHGTESHALITRAIEAIGAARQAIEEQKEAPPTPPGAPEPGSEEELEEELDKEKLDPGA